MKINPQVIYGAIALVCIIITNLWYAEANISQLHWLLAPTSTVLSWLLGEDAIYRSGEGYHFLNANIILGKTCSGFTFLLLMVCILFYHFHRQYRPIYAKLLFLDILISISFPATILVNTSRILVGLVGQQVGSQFLGDQPHLVLHEVIGLFMYIAGLVVAYHLMRWIYKNNISHA